MTWTPPPRGKRGRQQEFSDAASQTCLTPKVLFGLPLRQTTGVVESLLRLVGLDWAVPHFSTLSRRQKTLNVSLPYRGATGPLNLPIDSTGIKSEGEGEWNARKNAKPWKPTSAGAVTRNEAVGASRYLGKALWRRWSGYHRRSRAETKMNCIKLLGRSLISRDFNRQVAEIQVRIAVLNRYTALGIPVSEAVG